eukprot:TRINITY_DN8154_c0_g1_i1.p1 TRINITY_DN8154_c0_g1~~TRINITY_DN8154_c0_g1_i1.p1  ORF type:complete len:398 (+),score=94.86 TRINITY_DN8154_c0_g1_i1:70-1194(+)
MRDLSRPDLFSSVSHLLAHLFNLLKRYYNNNLDSYSRNQLLGGMDINEVAEQLHSWSIYVDLNVLMELPSICKLLFETELIANHIKNPSHYVYNAGSNNITPTPTQGTTTTNNNNNSSIEETNNNNNDFFTEDLSCNHFSLFVTTILSRLVIQGHSKYGLRALKRLIVLDSNKSVRDSVGSPLTQAVLQVSGYGGWGLPKTMSLRHLFIHYGGLRCVALDSNDDPYFRPICVDILHETTVAEWKRQSVNIIEIVLLYFVLPTLGNTTTTTGSSSIEKESQNKAVDVFARIYSIPEIRTNSFVEWANNTEKEEFSNFCRLALNKTKQLAKKEKSIISNNNNSTPKITTLSEIERGVKIAKLWISLPAKERKRVIR